MDFVGKPNRILQGEITVPGDKSISHRALMIGSLSQGLTQIDNFLSGQDCLATLKAMQQMGVRIDQPSLECLHIHGQGLHSLTAPSEPIDCANAGTMMRLIAGLLAAQPFNSVLIGDDSLQNRPMERITYPLSLMGANITGVKRDNKIYAPLSIKGSSLHGIRYELPVESAQIKSCLLLAGLFAKELTQIVEKGECRDHTERMLSAFGSDIVNQANHITLKPGKALQAQHIIIPGDFSSAAFFIGAASMQMGATLMLKAVGVNERRIGFLHMLNSMGAKITLHHLRYFNNEPVADIEVKGARLQGINVPLQWVVSAMDEFPMLFVVAACAKGETTIRGVSELRVKESDRIASMCQGLRSLGIAVKELPDGVIICGGSLQGGVVDSFGDHRVAMALLMASWMANDTITVKNCDNINTSFPNFSECAAQLGLEISKVQD
ncbi:MAG: 3-phosphoshikimate 1-carboxyvinyltransferase [Proteobacteria bacterium]|nr:3-phosphoshikimate 1-carboxyvinyltransferase [Pseudomonadota bacterium]